MEYLESIFTNFSYFQLAAVLAGSLFFAMSGFRALKDEHIHGYVQLFLSVFFLTVHGYILFNLPSETPLLKDLGVQQWLLAVFAPVVAILFLVIGVFNLLNARGAIALVKILMGASLIGCLYMLGQSWPMDVRIMLILAWSALWFGVELKTAH